MFTLIAQNKYGQQLELTNNKAYVITSIDGIDPPDAVINTTRNASADGSVFNSSYVDDRTITITLSINGPAEENRINLYKYFKAKYPVRLYYKNDTRDVYIDGYVKNINIDFFNKKQVAQINVFCPEPFFNGTEETVTDFSSVQPMFEFPFEVPYSENLLLYPYDYGSRTYKGITFTVNNDGSITANGTATAYSDQPLQMRTDTDTPFYLSDGTYTISGCPEGGSSTTYRILVGITVNGTWQTIAADAGEGAQFTYDSSMGALGVVIAVYQGATVNDVIFKPMITTGDSVPTEFSLYAAPEIEFGEILIEQEKDVINNGDVESGCLFVLRARGPLTNPVIYNAETNDFFKLNISMAESDEITINTMKKQKSVKLLSNGVTTNIIGNLVSGSTWLQLAPADNVFTTSAQTNPENLDAYCIVTNRFEGV